MNSFYVVQVYEKLRSPIKFVYRHTIRSGDIRPRSFLWAVRAVLSIY